jgi:hypothetical protein
MKNSQALKEIVVKADEESLNSAIAERQIAPEDIVSVMLQPGSGLAIGDSEAKYRVPERDEELNSGYLPGVLPPPAF